MPHQLHWSFGARESGVRPRKMTMLVNDWNARLTPAGRVAASMKTPASAAARACARAVSAVKRSPCGEGTSASLSLPLTSLYQPPSHLEHRLGFVFASWPREET